MPPDQRLALDCATEEFLKNLRSLLDVFALPVKTDAGIANVQANGTTVRAKSGLIQLLLNKHTCKQRYNQYSSLLQI